MSVAQDQLTELTQPEDNLIWNEILVFTFPATLLYYSNVPQAEISFKKIRQARRITQKENILCNDITPSQTANDVKEVCGNIFDFLISR